MASAPPPLPPSLLANLLFAVSTATHITGEVVQIVNKQAGIYYQALKTEDVKAHRILFTTLAAIIAYQSRLHGVILFTVGFIGKKFFEESLVSVSKEKAWVWRETNTLPLIFGACAFGIVRTQTWSLGALALGVWIGSFDFRTPPPVVSAPQEPQAEATAPPAQPAAIVAPPAAEAEVVKEPPVT